LLISNRLLASVLAALIVASYSLYENPWLKLISLPVLIVVISVFCVYSHLKSREQLIWSGQLLKIFAIRFFYPLIVMDEVLESVFDRSLITDGILSSGLAWRVLRGILFLIPLGLAVILLLSSADAVFGSLALSVAQSFVSVFNWSSVLKLGLSLLLSVAVLSMAAGWNADVEFTKTTSNKTIDGLVSGIVLTGLLLIYGVFLFVQLDQLVIKELPESYVKAEEMVKSGFWQMFLLAVLNTVLFFIVYRKTDWISQWILRIFIVASSLLMVSAGWKVWLYSYTFGLSYEKYFACYTAVFALGVLLYLVFASFTRHRCNVIKVIAFAALWSFAVATVSPIEKMIFHANLYFSKQDDTRITLSQLTQLSLDIKRDVEKVYTTELVADPSDIALWKSWRWDLEKHDCKRPWYESNLAVFRSCD